MNVSGFELGDRVRIKTTDDYWDCECNEDYIHPKSQETCLKCGCVSDEQPDSLVNEVNLMLKKKE